MLRRLATSALLTLLLAAPGVRADGVNVGEASRLRSLVPAEQLEDSARQQYAQMLRSANAQRALAPEGHPELLRLRRISGRIIPFAPRFNPRASQWQWEVNLIGSKQANAFCMPGGKIAFYTGLTNGLKLSDDEIAIVMGHEIAHALREHARERIAKTQLTQLGVGLLGQFVGQGKYADAFNIGGNLLTLKFSREDESEADVVGLDLAARAGYDPRAGVSLWQKMAKAGDSGGFAWLSTHPAGKDRIREIERRLPEVMPLYEQAKNTTTRKG
ncbi:M48 family metallopeptidase [Niveibacterium umoris]|uniref:Zn-dependent protease with chaperone function n=1 Tax=Niveibacterium umoris TaxID=1193620 RepID=A0A840BCJ2_9RHOO|nr:M48 family metallopeptidase [Niveibacterium umoris]MBB4010750.1 Zn-dependent protease with chaperone function [Niveibacterium umoris]